MMSRPYVFTSELPASSTLECYTASAQCRGKQELQEKCRELSRGDSTILISPVTDDMHFRAAVLRTETSSMPRNRCNVLLIAKIGYLRNDKMQVKLRQQGLMLVSQVAVTDEIMASCYSFSLKARLSPKWNRVSTWLIQGLDFLLGGKVKAVELQVAVNNGELALSIQTKALVLSLLQPEDLGVSLPLLEMFRSRARKSLSEEEMEGRKCYTLPNCTLGFVSSVSSEYTPVPHLPSYEHIRLYWKKQYGYILPEKEKLNFKVYFRCNPSMILSYPGSCVLKCPPHSFPTCESNSLATSFISDAFQRLPSICGLRLSFAAKCLMPNTQLQCASSVMSGSISKQVHIPPRSVTPSAGIGNTLQETSPTPVGTKRLSTPLLYDEDQMVPGRHNSSGTGDVASTQPAGSAERVTQPNKLVPKFGSLKSKPYVGPAALSTSATLPPPAKRPANMPTTPTFQRPAQTPARRPPQASTVACQRASTATITHTSPPTADQMQQTPSSSQRPNNTAMRNCPSGPAATGGAATGPRSGATRITQSKGTGPFQQVPASLISDEVEDDDAFYPSTHSKRSQSSVQGAMQTSLPVNETNLELATQVPVSKAKVADLRKWLWHNGVQFKTKGTKKDDLIRLVAEHTRQTGKAFRVL